MYEPFWHTNKLATEMWTLQRDAKPLTSTQTSILNLRLLDPTFQHIE